MARTETTTTYYTFNLVNEDGITLQKVTKRNVTTGRGRDHRASGSEHEDIITLSPKEVADLIQSAGDCLSFVLRPVEIQGGYTVLTKQGKEQD